MDHDAIITLVRDTLPIECELLGDDVLEHRVRGGSFVSADEGHQLNMVETISLVSGMVTIAQLVLPYVRNLAAPERARINRGHLYDLIKARTQSDRNVSLVLESRRTEVDTMLDRALRAED